MRKLLSILFALFISANIIADSTWTGGSDIFTHGSGTQSSPYQIETADQLAFIAEMVNSGITTYQGNYFKLMTNMNLNNIAWTPIGNSTTNYFAGNFDGNGFRVYNMKVTSGTYAGLFGVVSGGTYKNVTVQGTISASATDVGGLIGKSTSAITINNCINKVTITKGENVGGIVGNAIDLTITNCINHSNINGTGIVGGIVGKSSNSSTTSSSSTISNSVNNGKIECITQIQRKTTSRTTSNTYITYSYIGEIYVGGIIGYVENTATICQCSNYGIINVNASISIKLDHFNTVVGPPPVYTFYSYESSLNSYVGGISGRFSNGNIKRCVNSGGINMRTSNEFDGEYDAIGPYAYSNMKYVYSVGRQTDQSAGGIVGYTNQCSIIQCANIMNRVGTGVGSYQYPGFIGKSTSSSNIAYSYNTGIVHDGFGTSNVNVKNSYNAGQTTNLGVSSGTVTNSYYISGTGSGTTKTDAQMKSVTMPILLNVDSTVFLRDNAPYVNKGYPIFNGTFMKYIATNDAGGVSYHTATLNGNHRNCNPTSVGFEYKTSAANSYTSVTCSSTTAKTYQLSNLTEGTKYYARFWVLENGVKYYGDTVSFTTLACPAQPVRRDVVSICQGEYYEFAGRRLTTAGTYRDSFVAVTGCDSIIELVLSIYDTYKYDRFDTINRGESYEFYGEYLTEPGIYNAYIPITNRCNWVQLHLHVIEPAKTLYLSVNDASMGSVTGAGTYAHGSVVAIEAHANPGYYFVRWSDDNTDSIRAVTLTNNTSLTAYFAVEILADSAHCLRFKAVDGAATIALTKVGNPNSISIVYSTNHCNTWNNYTIGNVIQLANNQTVYFRATSSNATFSQGDANHYKFVMTGKIAADGNIMSLMSYRLDQTSVPNYYFMHLFSGCGSLISAPQLPATTIGNYSYARMFYACNNIETMPDLPATNLTRGCYMQMFRSCTKLKTLKTLPATTLAIKCYSLMFLDCINITNVPSLPATVLADDCYQEMFAGCTKLEELPVLPATNLKPLCYQRMFVGCRNLRETPALSADSLVAGCYRQMFMNCTNLRTLPNLPATSFADSCYKEMFKGCSLIRLNTTGTGTPWKIPNAASSSASTATNWGTDMFTGTAGTLQGAPVVGQNYYPVLSVQMSIARNDSAMGTVSGEGFYASGSSVSISATPSAHHHFVNWSNGISSASTSITITSDTLLTANFAIDQHTITANSNDATMGNVTGGGAFDYGQTATLTATPNAHYHFVSWSNGKTSPTITVSVYGDSTLTATFAIDQHTVTVNSSDAAKGSVSGSGAYNYGQTATLTATANEHYHFVSWSNGETTATITISVYGDSTLTAMFAGNRHTITANSNSTYMGSVSGGGVYEYGKTATLIATPESHYHFVSWSNGKTTSTITVPVYGDSTLTAIFTIDQHTVTVNSNDATMGNVSGGGLYNYGQTANLTAAANAHYHLVAWSNGKTTSNISVPVYGDSTLTATFAIDRHTVTVNQNDASMGNVTGGGTFDYGQTTTLIAIPNSHYHFISWSNGKRTTTITVPVYGDSTLTATFAIDQHTMTATSSDATKGNVTGSGSYDYGQNATLTATANTHYHFVSWSNGKTTPTIVVPMYGDSTLTATFAGDPHTITANSNSASMGSATGGGVFEYGGTATLTATPNAHHHFVSWSNGKTATTITVPVYGDSTLIATFAIDQHTVTASSTDVSKGNVSGGGTFDYGQTVTLTATPNAHYHFVSWSNGKTTTSITVPVYGDSILTATFAIDQHTVTVNSNDVTMGDVTGGGTFNYGHTVTLTATPNAHYHFVSWSNGKTATTITVPVYGDSTLTATFAIDQHTVTVNSNDATMGSVTGGGTFDYGQSTTLIATPNAHYHFVSWSNGKTTTSITVPVYGDSTLTATFAIDQHTVTVNSNDATMGSVTGGGTFDYGQSTTLTATPNAHYHFVSWSNGKTATTITVPVYGDSTLTATFAIDQHTVTVNSNDATMGSVTGGGTFDYGQSTTLTATPNAHYHFVSWSNGKTANTITVPVYGDSTLTAIFAINQHTVTVNSNDATMGSVTGGGTFDYGQTVTLTATANEHYHFVSWSNGQTTPTITVTVNNDTTLTATFAIDQHIVTVNSNDANMGDVTGGGTFDYGQTATLTATANEHYHFVSWSNGLTSARITITVSSDTTLTATFEADVYNVTATANYASRGTVTGSGQYSYLDRATLTAMPNEGYIFTGWSNGETNQTIYITVECDTAITAIFEEETTAVDDAEESRDIIIAPNPVKVGETICIKGDFTDEEMNGMVVEILSTDGTLVSRTTLSTTTIELDGINVVGTYIVRITTGTGKVYVEKLMVK